MENRMMYFDDTKMVVDEPPRDDNAAELGSDISDSPEKRHRPANGRRSTRRSLLFLPDIIASSSPYQPSSSPVVIRPRTPLRETRQFNTVEATNLSIRNLPLIVTSNITPIKPSAIPPAVDSQKTPKVENKVSTPSVATTTDPLLSAEQLWDNYQSELSQWRDLVGSSTKQVNTSPPDMSALSIEWIKKDRFLSRYLEILEPLYTTKPTNVFSERPIDSSTAQTISNTASSILFDLACLPELLDRQNSFLTGVRQFVSHIAQEQIRLNFPKESSFDLVKKFLDSS